MSISFVRIDDRMIHGLITLRWTKEMPCDGIIAVNDKAASNPILKEAYKAAAQDKKTFIWTMAHFFDVKDKVLASKLVTKWILPCYLINELVLGRILKLNLVTDSRSFEKRRVVL